MTDEHDDELDPVTPGDEARVRALLSDARATGPIPAEVAARLDDALVGLAADRSAGTGDPVDPSPVTGSEASIHPFARTRRHRVVALLGAAAAVAVVGLGIGALVDRDSDNTDDSAATDSSVERGDEASAGDDALKVAPGTESASAFDEADAPVWEKLVPAPGTATVRSRHLTHDLGVIQARYLPHPGRARYGQTLIHQPRGFTCATADWGRGVLVGAAYDGDPAYVAFRRPMGSSQVVEVLQCGTAEVLRSTTLPTDG